MEYGSLLTEAILKLLQFWVLNLPNFFAEHYVLRELLLVSTNLFFLFFFIGSTVLLYKCIKSKSDKSSLMFFVWIMVVSYPIYFRDYWYPTAFVWDENFHIASAAKYLNHVSFMEAHPPLGKLLIAAGEALLRPETHQASTFGFENVEYLKGDAPKDLLFVGYRLFPTLFGWLCVGVFSLILFEILSSYFWATIFSSLFIFENSFIVHFRTAMLESFMIFGCLLCLWGFLRALKVKELKSEEGIWALFCMVFGFTFGILTKLFSLSFILLWPMLLWFRNKKDERVFLMKTFVVQFAFFFVCFAGVWAYHIYQGQSYRSSLLFDGEFYASSDYEKIAYGLPNNFNRIEAFYIQLRDDLRFGFAYEERVPQFDMDTGSRSGSFPVMWPFASRPIEYRWSYTASTGEKRYLYLMPNAVVWGFCLLALVLALGVVLLTLITGKKIVSDKTYRQISIFLILYLSFMLPLISIRRILYLYHYFIPLILTMLIGAVLFLDLFKNSENKYVQKIGPNLLKSLPIFSMGMFFFFYAFTYYEPQECKEIEEHSLFRFWNIHAPYCKDPADPKAFLSPPSPDLRLRTFNKMDH